MSNGSFWLTLIMLVLIVMAKDVYVCGLERNFNFKPQHIIQEVLYCLQLVLLTLIDIFQIEVSNQQSASSVVAPADMDPVPGSRGLSLEMANRVSPSPSTERLPVRGSSGEIFTRSNQDV